MIICKPSALFLRVSKIDIESFAVSGVCRRESFVVARRPNNACDANYLGMTLVRGPYCLGNAEASKAARLSAMMRELRGSQPRNSLLHLDYATSGSTTLGHTYAHTCISYATLQ